MFFVAELRNDNGPMIQRIEHFDTSAQALDVGVKWAKEHGTTESDETIRSELEDGGYQEDKYSDWAINFGEVGK